MGVETDVGGARGSGMEGVMMGAKLPWIERRFTFDFPVEMHPDVVERLRGTPARLEERVKGLARAALLAHPDGGWSIQENAGHLLDLEALWSGRVDDFLAGEATLRAADMSNRATTSAGHNDRSIGEILFQFRGERERLIRRVEVLANEDFARIARHPRLGTSMRLVDALSFTAAHDDYHLARISELLRLIDGD